jgi:UDP-N-acetylglucosamine acyltransferase
VYRKGLKLSDALEELSVMAEDTPEIAIFTDSIKNSDRGIIR